MDTRLFLRPSDWARHAPDLGEFLFAHRFGDDWDASQVLMGKFREGEPGAAVLYSRHGGYDCSRRAIRLAERLGLPIAVHVDGNGQTGTHEWEDLAFLAWHNPDTGAHEIPAATISCEPRIPWATASDPVALAALLREAELLSRLGVILVATPTRAANLVPATTEESRMEYRDIKALIALRDEGVEVPGTPTVPATLLERVAGAQPRNHWDEVPGHPVEDWRREVANDDTRLGYLQWVDAQAETRAIERAQQRVSRTPGQRASGGPSQ